MVAVLEPNKTKIAKRVIEVLEFFSENTQKATVMDIARRYGRPQSSTSELLSSLVEMGLLYKDSRSRSYSPTPRVAALAVSAQPEIIRDGGLFNLMDNLAEATGHSIGLFGMVGTHVQIFRLAQGGEPMTREIGYGASEQLSASTAGLLLLATLAPDQVGRILWRLNAEAPADAKFNPAEIREHVAMFRRKGHAVGRAGFVPGVQLAATLLPRSCVQRPLALGVIYPAAATVEPEALVAMMNRGISQFAARREHDYQMPAPENFRISAVGAHHDQEPEQNSDRHLALAAGGVDNGRGAGAGHFAGHAGRANRAV